MPIAAKSRARATALVRAMAGARSFSDPVAFMAGCYNSSVFIDKYLGLLTIAASAWRPVIGEHFGSPTARRRIAPPRPRVERAVRSDTVAGTVGRRRHRRQHVFGLDQARIDRCAEAVVHDQG